MAKTSRKKPAASRKRSMAARRKSTSTPLHNVRFPNESTDYRNARTKLLHAEIELRRQVERVAAERRELPVSGVVPEDYVFEEGGAALDDTKTIRRVRLSELFGDESTLVAYSYMYGPQMAQPCPMCTSMLDALNGNAEHIGQRTNLVVIAKSPIERIRAFAKERGWSKLRLLSSAGNTYNRDYHGETPNGSQLPSLNVFALRNGKIHHFYNTELLFAPREPGRDPCHIDIIWPLWNLLDFTPVGRGTHWYPKLSYEA